MPSAIDFDRLWEYLIEQSPAARSSIHGQKHWRQVERNGLLLAERSGADVAVVRLFALFHDSRRWNDGYDPDHGARGADHASELRGTLFDLPDDAFELLRYACIRHADGLNHDDPTIGACWDADRLDLGRVGMTPDSRHMSTQFGREIADHGPIEAFLKPA